MRANPLLGPTQIARDSDGITIGKLGQEKGSSPLLALYNLLNGSPVEIRRSSKNID